MRALPEYALVDPVGSLAVGLLRRAAGSGGGGGGLMPGAAVQALTPVPEVLAPPFLRALAALALPPDVSQPPAEVPYHLLYAVVMMRLLVLVGRAGRRRRRLTGARRPSMVIVMVVVKGMMVDVTVDRVVHGRLMIGHVRAVGRAVGRRAVRVRGAHRAAGHVPLVQIKPAAAAIVVVLLRLLLLLLLVQQLLQEPRVLIADVRRRGGGGDGASRVTAAILGAVMMVGQ